jgi:hypothetical protein
VADRIKSPCQGCEFMVLHDPDTRPPETLICVDCLRKGFTLEHLAERVAEEVMSSSAPEPDADPTIDTESSASRQHYIDTGDYLSKEEPVTDTDTVQDEAVEQDAPEATEPEAQEKPAKKSTKGKAKAKADKPKKERKPVEQRRARGLLEADVLTITNKFVEGDIVLGDDEALTPHRIARLIKEQDGLDEAPSTGAVAAVLARWEKYGFAHLEEGPTAFGSYTADGVEHGLSALKERHAEARKAERAAAKEQADTAGSDAA